MKLNTCEKHDKPLHKGAKSSMLATTLLLMNVCMVHGVSNKFVDELLALLHKHLLPLDNCLPPTMYAVKTLINKVELNYTNIHACVNGCVLFRKQYETLDTYLKCESARFKEHGQSRVAVKVVQHFPLVPRLLHMYQAARTSELVTWHSQNGSMDGKVWHVPDSKAWEHIDATFPDFANEPKKCKVGARHRWNESIWGKK
jgi:hypothetical protein